ncbi:MAG: hypothetical protein LBQ88_01035 [Treponema sp.]|jgi:hypothetical protein|nr:hypothetical protein [Treponema sp.]
MMPRVLAAVAAFFLILPVSLGAQAADSSAGADSSGVKAPQWARDLRRAEIVAFGTFPFTLFLATFSMDIYRSSQHDWDGRYAPWPFKPAGAINMSTDEYLLSIGFAAAGSVLLSLTDYLIVLGKRRNYEKAMKNLPQGTPIITRKPWPAEEADDPPAEGAPILHEGP